jgi:hypothetical protein
MILYIASLPAEDNKRQYTGTLDAAHQWLKAMTATWPAAFKAGCTVAQIELTPNRANLLAALNGSTIVNHANPLREWRLTSRDGLREIKD